MTAPPGRLDDAAAPQPVPGAGRRRPVLRFLAAAVFTGLIALTVLPDRLFGLDRRSPWAQLIAFRWQLLALLLVLCVLLGVLTRFKRAAWPFMAGAVAMLVIGTVLVVPRFVADPVPTTGMPLKVLAFNVYEGRADVTAIAAAVRDQQPDIVSLEEAGDRFRQKITPLAEPLGYEVITSTGRGHPDVGGVTVLVSDRLGAVEHRIGSETSAFPYIEVTGGTLGALRFVAFHSVAPTVGEVGEWKHDLGLLSQWCSGPTPAVIAGDFNATLDHSPLRAGIQGCSDAADQRGDGLIPTWGPVQWMRDIGPQIDHIFETPGIEAATFDVLPLPGSDHRAILSTVRIPT
ncbi:endonuclease/exonuclease/phosphatase family protein [Pseudonocardia sp. GCM10023141]|uniref:endonuclease/exonuclease/phosphatase family protein n=1 Tax=Pseudonocardia sp. GCM10023141 TaxID=3252653 RepID=UPI0036148275